MPADEYFEKCVTLCQEAIEKGRAQHADFKLVAKNFARIGNARYRQGRLKEALDAYDHSLTENRLPEVVKKRAEVCHEEVHRRERTLAMESPLVVHPLPTVRWQGGRRTSHAP